MTDVNISVELMTDASQNRFDVALLISADSDLVGPIEAVQRLFPAKRVMAIFPPGARHLHSNKQLRLFYILAMLSWLRAFLLRRLSNRMALSCTGHMNGDKHGGQVL